MTKNKRRLSVADEIEKELDGALPCGDDMVRAERLRACPDSRSDAREGGLPARALVRDVEVCV